MYCVYYMLHEQRTRNLNIKSRGSRGGEELSLPPYIKVLDLLLSADNGFYSMVYEVTGV